jgi:hypothetical protein
MSNSLNILVKGNPVYRYSHEGKTFIEGRKGHDYEINYVNNSPIRKKIVVSVDGLNVISKDTNWNHGYVVDGYGSIIIPGWTKDNSNTAKFCFDKVSRSYSQVTEKGSVNNVGVIGCKVFQEHQVPQYTYPVYLYPQPPQVWPPYPQSEPFFCGNITRNVNNCGNMPLSQLCASDMQPQFAACDSFQLEQNSVQNDLPQSVGTGWGDNQKFETRTVNYIFEPNPEEVLLIYYDSREGLKSRGINLMEYGYSRPEPQAFPENKTIR